MRKITTILIGLLLTACGQNDRASHEAATTDAGITDAPLSVYAATVENAARLDGMTAAGVVLEAQSDLLRNAGDDDSKIVFNPGIRGKTDRFVMQFRKPE